MPRLKRMLFKPPVPAVPLLAAAGVFDAKKCGVAGDGATPDTASGQKPE